jgi:predicted MFS family arabinose efflux permease
MSFMSFAGLVGKLTSGIVIDKIGPRWAYLIVNGLCACGLLLFIFGDTSGFLVWIAMFLFGCALSSAMTCYSVATAQALGVRYFGMIWGIIFMAKGLIGDSIGVPLLAAMGASRAGWTSAFIIAALAVIVSASLFFFVRKSKKLMDLEEQALLDLSSDHCIQGSAE